MKYKELEYEQHLEIYPDIVPMKSVVPQWYKSLDRFVGGKANYNIGALNVGLKLCMPFLDSLIIGYSIPLITDLFVTQTEEGPIINWNNGQIKPIDLRTTPEVGTYPKPAGFSEKQFVWKLQTALQVPKGYSFLFTHPLNRFDLPFFTFSGVVDGGWVMGAGDVPVVIKDGFEGIIPAGTSIAQVIPFKQESWKAVKKENLSKESLLNTQRSLSKIYGWYKSTYWTKKEYL